MTEVMAAIDTPPGCRRCWRGRVVALQRMDRPGAPGLGESHQFVARHCGCGRGDDDEGEINRREPSADLQTMSAAAGEAGLGHWPLAKTMRRKPIA